MINEGMEHQWSEKWQGELKFLEKNMTQCHFVNHKSHMNCPGIGS
jgi:hypothetical protein